MKNTILANQNSYRCICIWDWDDKEAIIQAIKDDTLQIINNADIKKHWSKGTEHILDGNFNEEQMIADGWLPVYDDGQTLLY